MSEATKRSLRERIEKAAQAETNTLLIAEQLRMHRQQLIRELASVEAERDFVAEHNAIWGNA